ncbi:UDP-2,3-diacylglucosamine diphosphatase [Opacimonas viscosa]|uniref:UDP-2,3-diacylglucosamine hydrolase n=1 Tax=Opacimonas viscosa TaxID=2961944 RepID=A0AA41X3S7_9ALTE|nr:UDP-2,3-diacylglucosamine diphosphatase [Opacimonas viscosa]
MTAFTYFISDLHLSADRDDITQCFAEFMVNDAPKADALYILGDLFEVWVGDDDINPFTTHIAKIIHSVAQNIPVYFIHGNRDFALKSGFAKRAGMQILNEQTVIDVYGTPTVILHGDELCTRDIAYMKFRKKARSWWWPRLMLALPLQVRKNIANKGRKVSKDNKTKLSMDIMDVTPEEVVTVFQKHQVLRMIHGHTHRPDIHIHKVNDKDATRIVLGDWYSQGSVLQVSASKTELLTLKH